MFSELLSHLIGINYSFQNIFMFSLQVYKALLIQNQMKRCIYMQGSSLCGSFCIDVVSLKLHRFRLIAQVSHKKLLGDLTPFEIHRRFFFKRCPEEGGLLRRIYIYIYREREIVRYWNWVRGIWLIDWLIEAFDPPQKPYSSFSFNGFWACVWRSSSPWKLLLSCIWWTLCKRKRSVPDLHRKKFWYSPFGMLWRYQRRIHTSLHTKHQSALSRARWVWNRAPEVAKPDWWLLGQLDANHRSQVALKGSYTRFSVCCDAVNLSRRVQFFKSKTMPFAKRSTFAIYKTICLE